MTHQHKARARLALRMFACFLVLSAGATTQAQNAEPFKFFREYVGLNDGQIAAIRGGKALAKIVESRTPDEVFVFGAVYVESAQGACAARVQRSNVTFLCVVFAL